MIHTCLLYVSRYGTTRHIVQAFAQVLGPTRASPVAGFAPAARACEFVVIGTPIFGEVPDPHATRFMEENRDWLPERKIALFTSSLASDEKGRYCTSLSRLIGPSLVSGRRWGVVWMRPPWTPPTALRWKPLSTLPAHR